MKNPFSRFFKKPVQNAPPVQNKEIFTIMNTDKCSSDSESIYWENLSKEYLLYVFTLMRTDTFTKLIYGNID